MHAGMIYANLKSCLLVIELHYKVRSFRMKEPKLGGEVFLEQLCQASFRQGFLLQQQVQTGKLLSPPPSYPCLFHLYHPVLAMTISTDKSNR